MGVTLYQTRLAQSPDPPPDAPSLLECRVRFDGHPEATQQEVWQNPILPRLDCRFDKWFRAIGQEGTAHLQGRHAFFSYRLPLPAATQMPARLHIAVPFVTPQDLDSFSDARARQDFDRLMDVAQAVSSAMVEAKLLTPQRHSLEIVPELLDPSGTEPIRTHTAFAAFCIAATWLRDDNGPTFLRYRHWQAGSGRWSRFLGLGIRKSEV